MRISHQKTTRTPATGASPDMSALWGTKSALKPSGPQPRGVWFKESRFALFIHWGLYSEAAAQWRGKTYYGIAEWIMCRARIPVKDYEKLAKRFNPEEFDAKAWVRLAKTAGMKYIVITAKHHDGFALFKSKASRFNIVDATPFHRDPLKELAEACRNEGLKLGFYYSQFQDWHEPDAAGNTWDFKQKGDFDKYLREKAIPQIEELLTHYGPVALIWFDTPGSISHEAATTLRNLVNRLQPDCLVNSRLGHGLGDYSTLGDMEVPLTAPNGLWETVDTHNDTWAYAGYDHNWKSPRELISRLLRVAALGGNYMLNIGPTGRGVIPPESAEILRQTGKWIRRNTDSLYGTSASPLGLQPWGCSTHRPGKLYLHILHWPWDGEIWLHGLRVKVHQARFLVSGRNLKFFKKSASLCLRIPPMPPDHPVVVIVLDIDGTVKSTPPGLYIYNGLVNQFEAPFAKLKCCKVKNRRWMEKFGDWHTTDLVVQWHNGSSAEWAFSAIKPGVFYLFADYECLPSAEGSEFELTLGNTTWTFPVMCTGSRDYNRTRIRHGRLGMISLHKAGKYRLMIRAIHLKAKGAFALKKVALEPMEMRGMHENQ